PLDHALLLLAVATIGREPGSRWKHLGDRGAGRAERAVAERGLDEYASGVSPEMLVLDDRLEFCLALGGDECLPLLVDSAVDRDGVDEGLDEVLLVAQGRAGVDGAGD